MGRVNHMLVVGMVAATAALPVERAHAQSSPLRLSTLLPITGTYAN